ncbi:diacylglycerol/polyprenol kinase family protein [Acholeplasma granularum]|uniref:diacylglycerol/polyprenol kinase family protein n=1 Tax=Acholeplasma granularum TaxID=264635 RepID=UPI00047193F3|nr:hypothetical protein [Acholeplasma granularum]
MHILYYLLSSYAFIGIIIGISTILQKKNILGDEASRKFIHIGVSNWYFLVLIFMQDKNDIWWTLIPPISFVALNYLSYKMNLIKSMERSGKGNLGTVYFPISLLILVIFSIVFVENTMIGLMGILIMGYGDGLAAVIGKKYGKKEIGNGKSLIGSITMFVSSLVVAAIIINFSEGLNHIYMALVIAFISTIIEYITPKGLDNLTLPLGASLIYYLLILVI